MAGVDPATLCFVSVGAKDTLRNARATGQFVLNIGGGTHAAFINDSSTPFPPHVSEFDAARLTREPAARVRPFRVAEAPVSFEYRVSGEHVIGRCTMVFGEVLHIAARPDCLAEDGMPDACRIDRSPAWVATSGPGWARSSAWPGSPTTTGAPGGAHRRSEGRSPVRVVAVSDTHAPRFWQGAAPAVARHLRRADLILHAGDVCTADVLDELSGYAPVRAVLGNNDGRDVVGWGAAPTAEFTVDGLAVAMIHDSGPRTGRLSRLRRRFPLAELVVFGHSHIPLDEAGAGLRIVNPGSPTDKRRQPHGTIALLDVDGGRLRRVRIVPVT